MIRVSTPVAVAARYRSSRVRSWKHLSSSYCYYYDGAGVAGSCSPIIKTYYAGIDPTSGGGCGVARRFLSSPVTSDDTSGGGNNDTNSRRPQSSYRPHRENAGRYSNNRNRPVVGGGGRGGGGDPKRTGAGAGAAQNRHNASRNDVLNIFPRKAPVGEAMKPSLKPSPEQEEAVSKFFTKGRRDNNRGRQQQDNSSRNSGSSETQQHRGRGRTRDPRGRSSAATLPPSSSQPQPSKLAQMLRANDAPADSSPVGDRTRKPPLQQKNNTRTATEKRNTKSGGYASSPLRPSSVATDRKKHQYESTMKDPTDISNLRDALLVNRDKRQQSNKTKKSNQKSTSSNVQRNTTQAVTKKAASHSSPTTSTSSNKDFSSPLGSFIRRIQLEMAEQASKEKDKEKPDPLTGNFGSDTPLPQWRLPDENNRNRLRDIRQRQRQQQNSRSALNSGWGQEEHKDTKRPKFVDPKDQEIVLPLYDVSLNEASLLFREKTSSLRKILRSLGMLRRSVDKGDDEVSLDIDTMELIALELGKKFERHIHRAAPNDEEILLQRRAASEEDATGAEMTTPYESLPTRPPVVCLMGHVDHGKTTLMDALRRRSQDNSLSTGKKKKSKKASKKKSKKAQKSSSADVAGTEAGGITQVISAFQVPLVDKDEAAVTFLDTPGHAAFKAMRQSGSDAADIIVLVVAADDGVSSQTVEIINFYKSLIKGAGSGGISMVVAMNKIDKPGVDVQESRYRIESQLLEHGILVEGMPSSEESAYGPPVQLLPVSGLSGEGLDDLIEGLALQSEVMDLRADDRVRAEGIVMDARVDRGLGIVVDCIIRWGSLSKGDVVMSGTNKGKVRILKDMSNKPLKMGMPSQPVRVVGFESVPKAGDPIISVESEEIAEGLVEHRLAMAAHRGDDMNIPDPSNDDIELQSAGKHMMHDDWKEALERKHGIEADGSESLIRIPVIVKADADGTLAAIRDALVEMGEESHHSVMIEPVRVGVGPVLANDVQMAKEGGASIVCFNLKNEHVVEKMAEEEDVPLIGSNVIYSLLDDAKKKFASYLPPEPVEVVHGKGTVQQVFDIGGISEKVAGLQVDEGSLYKDKTEGKEGSVSCRFRVIRDGKVVSTKDLQATTLKHFKDDVDEIGRGKECGLALSGYSSYEAGDIIECFSVEMRHEFM